jgi:WD40 repeat protein
MPFSASNGRRVTGTMDKAEALAWAIAGDRLSARMIAFSPSESRLAVAGRDGIVRVLDASNGQELLSHDQHIDPNLDFSNSVAVSGDGKLFASALGEKGVELWDAASGKTKARFDVPEQKQEMLSPEGKHYTVDLGVCPLMGAFPPDTDLLAVVSGNQLGLFDLATGKPRLSLPWHGGNGGPLPAKSPPVLALSGEVAATACFSNSIDLWDVKTGKNIRQLERQEGTIAALSISPDAQLLASCTGFWGARASRIKGYDYGDHAVQLWHIASGRRLLNIKGHTKNVRSVVYAPDGRCFVSGGEDKTIRLWEAATGKQLLRWDVNETVNQVAVSPDGKKVAAVLDDGSVTLFAIDGRRPHQAPPVVDEKAFDSLWKDLGGEDGERAYRAVQALSESGDNFPSLVGKRLHPITIDLARLIADLDDKDFDRREAASKELAAVGPQAEPALRKALDETTSAEVRSRIKPLLKALDEWVVTDPDQLRALRAIWVLERIGTPEARAVLEDLAQGAPEARQTQEAKNALDFLDKRAAAAKP